MPGNLKDKLRPHYDNEWKAACIRWKKPLANRHSSLRHVSEVTVEELEQGAHKYIHCCQSHPDYGKADTDIGLVTHEPSSTFNLSQHFWVRGVDSLR